MTIEEAREVLVKLREMHDRLTETNFNISVVDLRDMLAQIVAWHIACLEEALNSSSQQGDVPSRE